MTRSQWMTELKKYLITLSREDMERALEYFNEIYEDKNEAGIPEKEIIYQFGNPRDAAKKILDDLAAASGSVVVMQGDNSQAVVHVGSKPEKQPKIKKEREKGSFPVWAVVLIIASIPILIGPAIGIIATVFALFITAWVLIGVMFIVSGALMIAGIAGSVYSIYTLTMSGSIGLAQLGMGLTALGLGVLILIAAIVVLRLWIKANVILFKLLIRAVTLGRVKVVILKKKMFPGDEMPAASTEGGQ